MSGLEALLKGRELAHRCFGRRVLHRRKIGTARKELLQLAGRRGVEIAVDVMEMAAHLDHIVLMSGDGDFRRLTEKIARCLDR